LLSLDENGKLGDHDCTVNDFREIDFVSGDVIMAR
jgi:hypothetical protein